MMLPGMLPVALNTMSKSQTQNPIDVKEILQALNQCVNNVTDWMIVSSLVKSMVTVKRSK